MIVYILFGIALTMLGSGQIMNNFVENSLQLAKKNYQLMYKRNSITLLQLKLAKLAEWSSCSKPCGNGTSTRTKSIFEQSNHNGEEGTG